MEAYRVNIDFELQIQKKTNRALKIHWQREWEYLFWWIEAQNKVLGAESKSLYHQDDLSYLKQITKRDQLFTHNHEKKSPINWWGDLRASSIISKHSLTQIRKNSLNNHESYIGVPQVYPCIAKRDFGFSGMGVFKLNNNTDYLKLEKRFPHERFLIEPFHKIKKHFGFYIFKDKNIFYETFHQEHEYRGCLFRRDFQETSDYKIFSQNLSRLKIYLEEQYCLKYGYGIDCYSHEQGIQPLCEINQRKTLASCSWSIFDKYFPNMQWGRSLILKANQNKANKSSKALEFKHQNNSQIACLRLSPLHGQFYQHYLIASQNESDLFRLTKEIENFFNLS